MDRIAHIENEMSDKFGIPRQSGLVEDVVSTIVFEPQYRNPDALKGLEGFSHIWLIWAFELSREDGEWSPMVRPPRLGGNTRMGVFATRSPNRPNPIGLSCVRLLRIDHTSRGPVLIVSGADLRNQTSIYDIKPYLPFTDSHPDATGGFAEDYVGLTLPVEYTDEADSLLPADIKKAVTSLLAQDPRPSYHSDPERIYGMSYSDYNIRFQVKNDVIYVVSVDNHSSSGSS